jgi:2-polyprenyl-3-methyl-5-hydroxy-6-metoxy-1,4-benzoquinol methylase
MPPPLSALARKKKLRYFFDDVPKTARILEIGCGDQWVGRELGKRGWSGYTGLDLVPPADVVGDIKRWKSLPLQPGSFDVVVAFEVVEHIDCFDEMFELLKPGGRLFLTSPRPRLDWLCRVLERAGLTQRRSSPHDFLIDFRRIPSFVPVEIRHVGLVSQWGKFLKPSR